MGVAVECERGFKSNFLFSVFMAGLFAVILFCMCGPCLAQSSEPASGSGENVSVLLAPLQALHDDLARIEATLDAFANAKWEYKILVPNVLEKSGFDPYKPNLAPLGQQGWELVTYSPDVGYILKRRVAPDSQ
ncbi:MULTISPECIES: hypothetical protein [unclassified Maridesulfovibrio]|uniref:hypothetical protein n=1 Tax=unclassified Maridesulfovibrio TaxID=2794999 RepID=UPI003B42954E